MIKKALTLVLALALFSSPLFSKADEYDAAMKFTGSLIKGGLDASASQTMVLLVIAASGASAITYATLDTSGVFDGKDRGLLEEKILQIKTALGPSQYFKTANAMARMEDPDSADIQALSLAGGVGLDVQRAYEMMVHSNFGF